MYTQTRTTLICPGGPMSHGFELKALFHWKGWWLGGWVAGRCHDELCHASPGVWLQHYSHVIMEINRTNKQGRERCAGDEGKKTKSKTEQKRDLSGEIMVCCLCEPARSFSAERSDEKKSPLPFAWNSELLVCMHY